MKSQKITNILLALVTLALLANLLVSLTRTREAGANQDSIPPAVEAARIAEHIAPDRLTAEIANGLKAVAQANEHIAAAIKEHARSNERVASSIEKVGRDMRAQQVNP
ncbi:hypothetical protein HZA56_13335 [Candidatus Poribacteria bacterium]|nr:hypothetical protein [Candidatus Poribacteria bacterium]